MPDHGRRRRLALRAAGLLLAAGCAVLLVVKADNGVRATDALSSIQSVDAGCRGGLLLQLPERPGQEARSDGRKAWRFRVSRGAHRARHSSSAVVSWAHIVGDPQDATVVLELIPGQGPGSCAGSVVVATPRGTK